MQNAAIQKVNNTGCNDSGWRQTDWLGRSRSVKKDMVDSKLSRSHQCAQAKAANSILGCISSRMVWHGLREMIILLTWHSLDCRVQLWVPNAGKTSINCSKFWKGPPQNLGWSTSPVRELDFFSLEKRMFWEKHKSSPPAPMLRLSRGQIQTLYSSTQQKNKRQ